MTRKAQQQTEAWQIRRFLTLMGQPQIDDLVDRESPDAVFGHGDLQIGVEITSVFNSELSDGTPLQQIEGIRRKVLSLAKREFCRLCSEHVHVNVQFGRTSTIDYERQPALGQEIALVVAKALANVPAEKVIFLRQTWGYEKSLPVEVEHIEIFRKAHSSFSTFRQSGSAAIPALDSEVLMTSIREKEALLDKYLESCDECWLVLSMDGSLPSSWVDTESFQTVGALKSRFDRVYLYMITDAIVRRLDVSSDV